MLTICFFGAFRRSELVSLDFEHVTVTPDGLVVHLARRKTDAVGAGTLIGLPKKADRTICPVRAYTEWLAASGISEGPLFRGVTKGGTLRRGRLGDDVVADIVKAACAAANYDAETFAAHSLRRGFITTAARSGVAERLIMKQSGHKRLDEMRGYIEEGTLFTENAAALI